jgi:hypothetical protein
MAIQNLDGVTHHPHQHSHHQHQHNRPSSSSTSSTLFGGNAPAPLERSYSSQTLRSGTYRDGAHSGGQGEHWDVHSGHGQDQPRRGVYTMPNAVSSQNGGSSAQSQQLTQPRKAVENYVNPYGPSDGSTSSVDGTTGRAGSQSSNNASSQSNNLTWGAPFPSLHLWPMNETFVMKMIHLPPGQKVSSDAFTPHLFSTMRS